MPKEELYKYAQKIYAEMIPKDNQKIFMDWLDTCPVVEYRSVENVQEDSATWVYTVDFAVVKENDNDR